MLWLLYTFMWFVSFLLSHVFLPTLKNIDEKYNYKLKFNFFEKNYFPQQYNFLGIFFFTFFYTNDSDFSSLENDGSNVKAIYYYRRNKFLLSKELWYFKYHWIHNNFLISKKFNESQLLWDNSEINTEFPINYAGLKNIKYSTWKIFYKNLKKKKKIHSNFENLFKHLKLKQRFNVNSLYFLNNIFLSFFFRVDLMDLNMFHDLIKKHVKFSNKNLKTSMSFEEFDYLHENAFYNYYENFLKNIITYKIIFKKNSFDSFWTDVFNQNLNIKLNTKMSHIIFKHTHQSHFDELNLYVESYFKRKIEKNRKQSYKLYFNFFKKNKFLDNYVPYYRVEKNKKLFNKSYLWWESFTNYIFKFKSIIIIDDFLKTQQNKWKLRFKNNNLTSKTINLPAYKLDSNYKVFFIRKTRIFNKNRYSRNRQLYRTGFYWCLWFSIFLGYGFLFLFYRFTINFGYMWWLMYLGLSIGFFTKTIKYRFYNLKIFLKEWKSNLNWILFFFKTSFKILNTFLKKTSLYLVKLVVNYKEKFIAFKVINFFLNLILKIKYYPKFFFFIYNVKFFLKKIKSKNHLKNIKFYFKKFIINFFKKFIN